MKTLKIIFVFLLFCNIIKGQINSSISFGPIYNKLSGINMELGFNTLLNKNFYLNLGASSNFFMPKSIQTKSISLRGGISNVFFKNNKINPSIGIDYCLDKYTSTKLNEREITHNIEIPLKLGFRINSHVDLYGGVITSLNLNNPEKIKWIDKMRLGIKYKF